MFVYVGVTLLAATSEDPVKVELANLDCSTRSPEDRRAIPHQSRPRMQLASEQQPSLSKTRETTDLVGG